MLINLKIARIEKGYKQYELARKAGVSRYYLNALENGRAKNPSVQIMKNLAAALDTTVEELFFKEG
jgi:putative transcriptional regulator